MFILNVVEALSGTPRSEYSNFPHPLPTVVFVVLGPLPLIVAGVGYVAAIVAGDGGFQLLSPFSPSFLTPGVSTRPLPYTGPPLSSSSSAPHQC